ncbi:MAG: GTPase HflX [Candidatus Omnitrophota bacterium]
MSEKVLLVVISFHKDHDWPIQDIANELNALVDSCGGEVAEIVLCKNLEPNAAFLIGEGKVKEIAESCLVKDIDTVIFSEELKGSQQRNLEEVFDTKTIDRTQLILDIFAKRATSQEGKMQVELAQLEYLLPRLTGKGVELSRPGGGIGTLGPGETKLETDRRRIDQRITKLHRELKGVSAARKVNRKKRQENKIPTISLVGYTNAGKSTLLNRLTDAHQETKDGLFTTLDPLSRQYVLPSHQKVILSDTVGFMHQLPHGLIEAFKATLEEVVESDLLLHVIDVSHIKFRDYHRSVLQVLREIKAEDKPVITVFNKIDQMVDQESFKELADHFENAVFISAKTGQGIDSLIHEMEKFLGSSFVEIDTYIPISRMDLINLVHKQGQVHTVEYLSDKIHVCATAPSSVARKFEKI